MKTLSKLYEAANDSISNKIQKGKLSKTKIKWKPSDETAVPAKLLDAAGQILYNATEIQPNYKDMEKWEVKEYEAVYNDNVIDYYKYKRNMEDDLELFNTKLKPYGYTVDSFIKMIEG